MRTAIIIIALLCGSAFATHTCGVGVGGGKCYVDWVSGVDTNSGATNVLPWKHMHGMAGATSNASTQVPQPGDSYILKGNVTWPNAALGVLVDWNGTSGSPVYIGVDPTYFSAVTGTVNTLGTAVTWVTGVHGPGSGCNTSCNLFGDFTAAMVGQTITVNGGNCTIASVTDATHLACTVTQGTNSGVAFSINLWGRPILDAGGSVVGSNAGLANVMFRPYGNWNIVDNIEFRGLFWTGTPGPGEASVIEFAGGTPGQGTHDEIKNVFIHGWSHGVRTSPTCTGETNLVLGDTGVPNNNVGTSLHDFIITGLDVDNTSGTSGGAIFGSPPIVYNGFIEWDSQGEISNGINTIHDLAIFNIGPTFQIANACGGVAHTNGIELNAQSTDVTIYNTVIAHLGTGAAAFWCATNSGVNCYAFNNVIWDTDTGNILDPSPSLTNNGCANGGTYCNVAGNTFYYHDTVECGPDSNPVANCTGSNAALTAVTHQNGHYITSGTISTAPPTPTLTTNLDTAGSTNAGMSKSTATTDLYTSAQTFAFSPTSAGSPSVGTGTSDASMYSTINALDSTAGAAFLRDTTYGVAIDRTSWTVTGFARSTNARHSTPDIGAYEFSGSNNVVAPLPFMAQLH